MCHWYQTCFSGLSFSKDPQEKVPYALVFIGHIGKPTSLKCIAALSVLTLSWACEHHWIVWVSPGLTGQLLSKQLLELSELSDQARTLSGSPATQEWVTFRHSWHHIWWQTIWLIPMSLCPHLTVCSKDRPRKHRHAVDTRPRWKRATGETPACPESHTTCNIPSKSTIFKWQILVHFEPHLIWFWFWICLDSLFPTSFKSTHVY